MKFKIFFDNKEGILSVENNDFTTTLKNIDEIILEAFNNFLTIEDYKKLDTYIKKAEKMVKIKSKLQADITIYPIPNLIISEEDKPIWVVLAYNYQRDKNHQNILLTIKAKEKINNFLKETAKEIKSKFKDKNEFEVLKNIKEIGFEMIHNNLYYIVKAFNEIYKIKLEKNEWSKK